MKNEILSTGLTVQTMISDLVCKTMPTAAISSGMVSRVSFTSVIESLSLKYPIEDRPENLGLTALSGWFESRGEKLPTHVVREIRKAWLDDAMRADFAAKR